MCRDAGHETQKLQPAANRTKVEQNFSFRVSCNSLVKKEKNTPKMSTTTVGGARVHSRRSTARTTMPVNMKQRGRERGGGGQKGKRGNKPQRREGYFFSIYVKYRVLLAKFESSIQSAHGRWNSRAHFLRVSIFYTFRSHSTTLLEQPRRASCRAVTSVAKDERFNVP